MKKSIIREMFYGNIGNEQNFRVDEHHKKISNIFLDKFEKYTKDYTTEQIIELEKLIDLNEDVWADLADMYYEYGFKLGILIGTQCLDIFNK